MISAQDLHTLYEWAKKTKFPTNKKAPVTEGYCDVFVPHYWLKSTAKSILLRKKLMTEEVKNIYQNSDILYSGYSLFEPGTVINPHKDPNIYREPYKRIQVPLSIPEREKCYMTWGGNRIHWEEGVCQVYNVMHNIHDGANLSDRPMEFLFVDVKLDTIVECQ